MKYWKHFYEILEISSELLASAYVAAFPIYALAFSELKREGFPVSEEGEQTYIEMDGKKYSIQTSILDSYQTWEEMKTENPELTDEQDSDDGLEELSFSGVEELDFSSSPTLSDEDDDGYIHFSGSGRDGEALVKDELADLPMPFAAREDDDIMKTEVSAEAEPVIKKHTIEEAIPEAVNEATEPKEDVAEESEEREGEAEEPVEPEYEKKPEINEIDNEEVTDEETSIEEPEQAEAEMVVEKNVHDEDDYMIDLNMDAVEESVTKNDFASDNLREGIDYIGVAPGSQSEVEESEDALFASFVPTREESVKQKHKKEIEEAPPFMKRDDFTFYYDHIIVQTPDGEEDEAELIIAPISLAEGSKQIMFWVNTESGSHADYAVEGKCTKIIRIGYSEVIVGGEMRAGKFVPSVTLTPKEVHRGFRLVEEDNMMSGEKGHVILTDTGIEIHIVPISFENENGKAEFYYLINRRGTYECGDVDTSFDYAGKKMEIMGRWKDDVLYSAVQPKT